MVDYLREECLQYSPIESQPICFSVHAIMRGKNESVGVRTEGRNPGKMQETHWILEMCHDLSSPVLRRFQELGVASFLNGRDLPLLR
ncbi:hypothetical protein [Sulfidibacter corallicola]|uniref:Uncharacterized protein n=1 Tax=Sulfidibacter corallicola TaxID=2818388 RepID=A0A8A4TTD5_SULCO|nr:hypothetical protein [Sulfidibacter corallicola]QTD53219.1 hypothetical protein J3U87_12250 [Sulfidibacter corallicola]